MSLTQTIGFAFGENWARYQRQMTPEHVRQARNSLAEALGDLQGKTFLDIGSGSGLFSLAARKMGARVTSFDVDNKSVECTCGLRLYYEPDSISDWSIMQGSVLDVAFMERLGEFDMVYAWGSLHHTGDMWRAVELALARVKPGGLICLSIYNQQGRASRWWGRVKRLYNRMPWGLRWALVWACFVRLWGPTLARDLARKGDAWASWRAYGDNRGMSPMVDLIDFVGGWPWEVARPEEVFEFCRARGFELRMLKTCGKGLGCNEFVLRRSSNE